MNIARCARLSGASLLVLAACGGGGEGAHGTTRSAETVVPLYYATYPGSPSWHYYASEVDDSGNTFVLARAAGPENDYNVVHKLDANGQHVWSVDAFNDANEPLTSLRVRDATVVVGGTYLTQSRTAVQLDVRAFTTDGAPMFRYVAPIGTSGGPVDVCGDGTIVAAGSQASTGYLVKLDPSGAVIWSKSTVGSRATKVRCNGSGAARLLATAANGTLAAARYGADGGQEWSWTGSDASVQSASFDVDGSGDTIVAAGLRRADGTQYIAAYALDGGGALLWSWSSDGPSDTFTSVAADDAGDVFLAGARGGHALTVRLDSTGAPVWTREDASAGGSARGVSIDGGGNAFMCGDTGNAVLYGADDGATLWSYAISGFVPRSADVTNAVARCIGETSTYGLAILAFPSQ